MGQEVSTTVSIAHQHPTFSFPSSHTFPNEPSSIYYKDPSKQLVLLSDIIYMCARTYTYTCSCLLPQGTPRLFEYSIIRNEAYDNQ